MIKRVNAILLLMLGIWAALWAPTAHAGTVTDTVGGTTYQAAPGDVDRVTIAARDDLNDNFYTRFAAESGGAGITAGTGCTGVGTVTCPGIGSATVFLEDRDDRISVGSSNQYSVVLTVYGGPGNDDLRYLQGSFYGDAGDDTLQVTPTISSGGDLLDGGSGNDTIVGIRGPDTVRGGTGVDTLTFLGTRAGVVVTLDDLANDGTALDGANVHSDVENLVGSTADDTLGGSAAANMLDGDEGSDTIQGNGGRDRLLGGDGDDVINARDGEADTIDCGFGADTATVDPVDQVANCEHVLLPDDDRDGVTAPSDCDDGNAGIHPGAIDVPNDGIDEDCVGGDAVAVVDADGDGASSATDCDDHDARRFPGNRDIPGDRLDQDCDGHDDAYPRQRAGVLFTTVGVKPHQTRFLTLTAVAVKRGDTIRVLCKGRGCPRSSIRRRVARSGRAVKLLRGAWKHVTLGPGARVTVLFTRSGYAEKRVRFTTRRKFGAAPNRAITCRPPGGRRTRC